MHTSCGLKRDLSTMPEIEHSVNTVPGANTGPVVPSCAAPFAGLLGFCIGGERARALEALTEETHVFLDRTLRPYGKLKIPRTSL